MTELRPCPFCGKEAEPINNILMGAVLKDATCYSCGISLSVEGWNSRPIEDELRARIKELEAELQNGKELLQMAMDGTK